jgi:intracellular sulfur oxidation DsrE/DsrF family protein
MPISRKHFISATAVGVSAAALSSFDTVAEAAVDRAPVHFHILKPTEFDKAAMLQRLTVSNDHKQVFQSVSPIVVAPGVASVYIHMQNSMNAYQFSLGLGNLATLAVMIGPSIVFALNDSMWKKYSIGKMLGLAPTNTYYQASSNLDLSADPDDPSGVYQDWSAEAVLKRGGQFFVCHNATTAVAAIIAMKMSTTSPKAVLADFEKNLLPGFLMVPAGVAAVQEALENGWKYFAIL